MIVFYSFFLLVVQRVVLNQILHCYCNAKVWKIKTEGARRAIVTGAKLRAGGEEQNQTQMPPPPRMHQPNATFIFKKCGQLFEKGFRNLKKKLSISFQKRIHLWQFDQYSHLAISLNIFGFRPIIRKRIKNFVKSLSLVCRACRDESINV